MLSKLQNLSVSFYNPVDLNIFLANLTNTWGKSSKEILAESSIRTATTASSSSSSAAAAAPAVAEATTSAVARTNTEEEKPGNLGLVSLRSLDIKNRVPDTNYIRWRVFKNTLDRLPSLQHLALTGIGFIGGKSNTENNIAHGGYDHTIETIANTSASTIIPNGNSNLGAGAHYQGDPDDDDDDYDDDEDDEDDGEDDYQARSFENGSGESSRSYPQLRSLALSFCHCPVTIMLDLDRIFPKLTSLEVNKCRSTWLHVFEPDPLNPTSHLGMSLSLPSSTSSLTSTAATTVTMNTTSSTTVTTTTNTNITTTSATTTAGNAHGTTTAQNTVQRVPFAELTHLKLVERYGNEGLIYEIVKARPGLVSLETHQISFNIDTLLSMATFCSNHRRFFNRFSLLPCWNGLQTRRDYERLFEAPFLSRAKHIYIRQEITDKMYFASTLISLHIGAGLFKQAAIENDSVSVWNEILRKLPKLEILRIDRYIKDYQIFEGLGRSPPQTPPIEHSEADQSTSSLKLDQIIEAICPTASRDTGVIEDWTGERPYLRELHHVFRQQILIENSYNGSGSWSDSAFLAPRDLTA
ncbi:hypothetical protein BGZ65_000128 [Modicella reniformis]|uniref:Uncharacterized protein n=1 Tax=Modicella reniformis TaxID=1440133 RepID=A0A9P6SUF8_9FUNG|nr:hypothetical protein BGZ65_000128 [Modicella reniformis]